MLFVILEFTLQAFYRRVTRQAVSGSYGVIIFACNSPSSIFKMLPQHDRLAELCAFKYGLSAHRFIKTIFPCTATMLTKFFAFFALLSIVALATPQTTSLPVPTLSRPYQGVTCRFLRIYCLFPLTWLFPVFSFNPSLGACGITNTGNDVVASVPKVVFTYFQ